MATDGIAAAGAAIANAGSTVAFTGAGVSTESGLPDFRGPDGLWAHQDPDAFHARRLEADPADFWDRWVDLRADLVDGSVTPNPAHEALAALEGAGLLDAVITQNVDGLHAAAGTETVITLHGRADRATCRSCGATVAAGPVVDRARGGELPPRCCDCGGVLEPDAVLFGQRLPQEALMRARWRAETADVLVVVGSSLSVEPAASLPRTALEHGATLVVVNLEETPLCRRAAHTFRDPAGEVLPRIAAAAGVSG